MRAVLFGIALKYDHLHRLLAPNMLLSHPKLIANPFLKHFNGVFETAMKAKGFVVKGRGKSPTMQDQAQDPCLKLELWPLHRGGRRIRG